MIGKRIKWIPILTILLIISLALTSFLVYAQYSGYEWYTAYQVVNMGESPADITVQYYDTDGVEQTAAQKTITDVPPGGSVLILQFSDDPNLPSGRYSAVVSSDQPIVAITNQQLVPDGSQNYNPGPPFSSYSGASQGDVKVTLPAVMYNWYNYYTIIYVMNVGSSGATNVDVAYVPSSIGGEVTGASGVTDLDNSIPKYASLEISQESLSALGAPSGTYQGRFLGSAIITSDQPIIAVVNQHNTNEKKLMTYNGFISGSTDIAAPSIMKSYYGYYTTLLIANPSDSETAHVTIQYDPNTSESFYNEVEEGSTIDTVTVSYDIDPQTSLMRYDGPPATDVQSDLDDPPHAYIKFFGSARITSDLPVMVQVNIEAIASGDGQGGSYNGIPLDEASLEIVAPVILADYYGYYTSLVVQNTTSSSGSCDITYTSDSVYSAVKNHSATYSHSIAANGGFMIYEGRKGGQEIGDINSDPQWRSGGEQQFIGAATIVCDVEVVAIVNEESDVAQSDSMYTMNTFNK